MGQKGVGITSVLRRWKERYRGPVVPISPDSALIRRERAGMLKSEDSRLKLVIFTREQFERGRQ